MQSNLRSFALRAIPMAAVLAFSQLAHAGLVAATSGNATVQGSPYAPVTTGGSISTLTIPTPAANTSNASFTSGSGATLATVTFGGDAAAVKTSIPGYAAAPVANSGGTTTSPFLSTNTTTSSATAYSGSQTASGGTVTAGGVYTLTFATLQSYLGLLWGSIGTGDLLTFYSAAGAVVGTVNGTTAASAGTNFNPANGSQNFGGSQYELINFLNGGTFKSVVFSQTVSAAFESANIQYSTTNVSAVPEPGSMVLLGIGLVGLAASRRRKAIRN